MSRLIAAHPAPVLARTEQRDPAQNETQLFQRFFPAALPFSVHDITGGSETELQASVEGSHDTVDLPLVIEQSNYLYNLQRRAAVGESPVRLVEALEDLLRNNRTGNWENSWVRIPIRLLGNEVRDIL